NCAASGVVVESIWVESVGRTTAKLSLPSKTDLKKLKVIELDAYLDAAGLGTSIDLCD
ncbi:MAG: hypothetical protein RL038_1083, partial [Actinomycetota bacterium]